MKKIFFSACIGSAFLTILFFVCGSVSERAVFMLLTRVFGTLFYHIAMRLTVAYLAKPYYNYRNIWFKEKRFEKTIYRKLRVRRWKKILPSGNPASYSLTNRSITAIVQTMCRNEVIHEVSALLSLAPIALGFRYGGWSAWISTSLLGSMCDLLFVCLQRYNRPRLVRLIERKNIRQM